MNTNLLNIILVVNYLILWIDIDQNPVDLDPLAHNVVEEWNSVEVPSRRGSSQWTSGCVDNRTAFGEDDSNTREVGERELLLVFSEACDLCSDRACENVASVFRWKEKSARRWHIRLHGRSA